MPPPTRVAATKKYGTRLLLVCASLVLVLLLAEGLVRLAAPQNLSGTWRIETQTGLRVNKSSGTARHQFGERVVTYRFYEPHLRDTPPKDGPVRVLALGDSFTFGWLLKAEDTFVAHLQRYADDAFGTDAIQLLNAASGGWGTSHYVAFAEERAASIEPDVLLVFLNSDDIGRSLKRAHYIFTDGARPALRRVPQPRSRLKKLVNSVFLYQGLLEHSHLAQFLRNSAVMLSSRQARRRAGDPDAAAAAGGPASRELEAAGQEAIQVGGALFRRLKRWSDRHGVSLYVVAIGVIDPAHRAAGSEPTRVFLEQAPTLFDDLGVPFFDASRTILAKKNAEPGRYVIQGDYHPNEEGAQLIAEETWPFIREVLARHLEGAGAVPACGPPLADGAWGLRWFLSECEESGYV